MTTLEIKRLDYANGSPGGGGIVTTSPTKSLRHSSNSSQIHQIHVKTLENGTASLPTNNDSSSPLAVENVSGKEIEIPISIVKSQSFHNTLTADANANANAPTTPTKSLILLSASPVKALSVDGGETSRHLSAASSENNVVVVGAAKEDVKASLNKLEKSDLDVSVNDVSGADVRFNKYGFIEKTSPAEAAESNATLSKGKTLKPGGAKADALSVTSSSNQTNLKNTDVEKFSENIPIKVIRERERKWMDMLDNYDDWMKKRFKKVKSRCRKGIPQSMRSKAWMYLTGAILEKEKQPNYYVECLENKKEVDIAKYVEDIKKDLHRQFPSHELFIKEEGRVMLFNVLKAYAVHNREVGYCQAQGPIAALLLMHMPEEDAFWMLIRISDFYLREYFKPGLEKVQIDGKALFCLFRKEHEAAHKLLDKQGIDPILYMTEWFMCIYARTLPWCTVLRVWDMFFCEGVKILYKVGLYLMLNAFGTRAKMQRCNQHGMYETLNCLKNLPIECLDEASLVRGSNEIDFSTADFAKAFEKSKQEFQKARPPNNPKAAPPVSSYKAAKKK